MVINFKVLEDRRPIGCEWVFKLRLKVVNGFIDCYKTRLVVKCYSKIVGRGLLILISKSWLSSKQSEYKQT